MFLIHSTACSLLSDYIDEDRIYNYKYNKERILTPPKTPEPPAVGPYGENRPQSCVTNGDGSSYLLPSLCSLLIPLGEHSHLECYNAICIYLIGGGEEGVVNHRHAHHYHVLVVILTFLACTA